MNSTGQRRIEEKRKTQTLQTYVEIRGLKTVLGDDGAPIIYRYSLKYIIYFSVVPDPLGIKTNFENKCFNTINNALVPLP